LPARRHATHTPRLARLDSVHLVPRGSVLPRTPHVFFFYAHVHHRDLPSFPTRRSSDLSQTGTFGGTGASNPQALNRARQSARRLDRKSTRLNSSHQIISYAVFCLKKKAQPGTLAVGPIESHMGSIEVRAPAETARESLT